MEREAGVEVGFKAACRSTFKQVRSHLHVLRKGPALVASSFLWSRVL